MDWYYNNVDTEWIWMWHWTIRFIKINLLDLGTSIEQCCARNHHVSEESPYFIPVSMRYLSYFVSSGNNLFSMGAERIYTFLFLSYLTNKSYLYSWCWRIFMDYPMFFGTIGFSGMRDYKWKTTGLIWSNMDQISSRSVRWYLSLQNKFIFNF